MANNKGSQTCNFFIRTFCCIKYPEGCKLMNDKLNCGQKTGGLMSG